jgi:hypothetical protein
MTKAFAPLAALLLLASLTPQPATAQTEPAKANPAWLKACTDSGSGTLDYARCLVEHRTALTEAQSALLGQINAALAKSGPAGTDYTAAAATLAEAQTHWEVFVGPDCAVIDDVFGYGTAQGAAGETCVIDHYVSRNAQLKDLKAGYNL